MQTRHGTNAIINTWKFGIPMDNSLNSSSSNPHRDKMKTVW